MLWPQVVMQVDLGGPMAAPKLAAVTAAANAACGSALTGQPDGYISDPTSCRYDPTKDAALLCLAAGGTNATEACLSLVEATAVNKIWYGPTATGAVPAPATDNGRGPKGALAAQQLWFGPERGTLLSGQIIWDGLAGAQVPLGPTQIVALALLDPAFADPSFMNASGNGQNAWKTIGYAGTNSFAKVFSAAQQRLGGSDDPDLTAFAARGGRLVMWHGTSDSLIPPQGSVHYYEALSKNAGGYAEAQTFARLYLAPGFDHCFLPGQPGTHPPFPGGVGDPGNGLMEVLQTWLEGKQIPDDVPATSEQDATPVRKRPWCAYPKKLKYLSGDVDTGTFECE
jgi:Tannase and feruloyl esterase